MFEKNIKYKFEVKTNSQSIFYTGEAIDEDETFVKVKTIMSETVMLNKKEIIRSMQVKEQDRGNSNDVRTM